MAAVDIIRKKRDGLKLTEGEIQDFVNGVARRSWSEYQASALLMAIFLRGMDDDETAELTRAMVGSGQRLDFSDLPGPKVDKHSTGGVGDKTSLILAPLVAACGVYVPMMSGRGLGHTGGTLDKLESIPGFRVHLPLNEFRAVLRDVGCAMVGATLEIAPADKILYALRDVTATVESIPLITASILSKKIAEGIDALVMDVKCGHGAFMKNRSDAQALAKSIVANGKANGVRTEAFITDMNLPLGSAIGNALEVKECIEILKGAKRKGELFDLTIALAERMIAVTGRADGKAAVDKALSSGAALEKLRQLIARQGGNPKIIDDPHLLPSAPNRHLLKAVKAGYVTGVNAQSFGEACMALGAGRQRAEDAIDPSVGAILHARPGNTVKAGDTLAEIHYRDEASLALALPKFQAAFAFDQGGSPTLDYQPLILEMLH